MNGPAEKAVADRLEKLADSFYPKSANSPEGAARMSLRSIAGELRKERTVTSVEAILEQAAQRLDRQYSAQADVVREILDSLRVQAAPAGAAPAPKTEKAEIRPFRRADGGIGYEAIPIIEAEAPPAVPAPASRPGGGLNQREYDQLLGSQAKPPAPAPSANKIFTEDAAAAARARLKAKLGRVQSGLDPETLIDGITLAGYHVERGARTFAAYARAMVGDMGDIVKPYLQQWYMALRADPKAADMRASMDKASSVEDLTEAEIDALLADSGTPENAQQAQNADTKETPDDPAASGSAPTVDQPLAAGQPANTARRGAQQPRKRAGRSDDRSVRGTGGLFESAADEGPPLGDGGKPVAVPAGADGTVAGGVQRVPTRDFRPAPGGLKREGSWFATAARNIDLIELALRIQADKRQATPEEQAQLAKYVGFGASEIRNNLFPVPSQWDRQQDPKRLIWPNLVREARWKPLAERMAALPEEWQRSVLQSTQYAHYTSEGVIRSVWSGLQRLGFTGGKVLEPGMGIGSFNMLMPDTVHATSRYTGVEFDGPTALIAQLLSPDQNMLHEDFIKRKFPRDFFDLSVGNPPFSQTKILGDPDYEKFGFMLHDFFFAKSLDRVRPGGLLVFVTSKGTMDKQSDKARKYLAERADLLGAIRLPSTAFEDNAGTSVITDVLFLRKRAPGQEPAGPAWTGVQTIETKDGPAVVNEYFAANPDMVLGEQRISGNVDDFGRRINSNGMGGAKYTVVSYDTTPEQLDERFAKAIERLPENVYSPLSANSEQVKRETAKVDFDPSIKREGVVYQGTDGKLRRVQSGVGVALADGVKLSAKDEAWFKGYVGVRDMVQAARLAQAQDGEWEKALKALNKAYDAFRKEHGPINDFRTQTRRGTDEEGNEVTTEIRIFKNRRLFREDYDSAVMTQLEVINEAGEIIKAPFLLGRTIGKPVVRTVKTVGDALAVSLDETGRLDLDDIARRMSLKRDEVIDALGTQVYKTPGGQWHLSDEYLSGDVVAKLEEAELAARLDPSLARNVQALKEVQPEKLGPSQISVKAGASWVPAEYVNEFAKEIGAGAVTFDSKTESWQVKGGNERNARRAGAEYGTADRSPSELLESVLNSQSITIKRTDADKKTYTDTAATTAANEMARKIKEKFKGWVWTDADRASNLVEIYNKRFNNIAPRRFDGSHMTLPGVSLRFSLHPHQKRAIWRQVQTGDTYLAHAVGAGKTIEMIAGGMEQKRLGLINKPIYAVPNHMLEQFANEFMELYPLANIMVADDENFSAERRKAFVAAATLNAPDAIVITHSAFERIGVKEETVAPIRDEILDDLQTELEDSDKGDRVRRSQLQQQIEAVEQRFDSIVGAGKKDSTIKFEDIGADFVYVDEAHAFRKLDFTTNQKIKGIDPNGSRRALDMYVKTRYLGRKRPGRAMVFASGTPVTNTMGELYTIMRFFAPEELSRGGIATFDAWARQFGEAVPALEANAAGRYEVVERFAKFDNVPELMSRVRQFMDVLTSEHLGALVKRPDIEGGKPDLITVEPTEALKKYMKGVLLPRLEKSRKWKPSKDEPFNPDPVIAITSDGRFAALDPRFVGEKIDEDKTPTKLTRMADEVARIYRDSAGNEYLDKQGKPEAVKGSTQIVFYNLGFGEQSMRNRGFDARGTLTKRLVAQGVKREHILWFDDADTDSKKETMFKAMRNGQARVLIGSAKKMGTGVNVQKRLLALHYFDPPWYPSDVEQPHGRIIRQGNQNSLATIKWYATKGTYDSTMWQMVARKQRFIDQAFSGDKSLRTMEDMSEASMFEQAAAVASGDPRALQLAGLRQDVERLERLQAAHASEQIAVRSGLRGAEWNIESYAKRVKTYGDAFKAIGGGYYSFSTATVGRKTFDKVGEFGQALKDAFNQKAADAVMDPGTKARELATLPSGITVRMEAGEDREGKPTGDHELVLRAGALDIQLTGYAAALGEKVDAVGLGRRVINAINGIEADLNRAKGLLVNEETDATRLRKKLGAPFEYQQELAEKIGDLKRLEEELRAEGEAEAKAAAVEVVIDEAGAADTDAAGNPASLASAQALAEQLAGQGLLRINVARSVDDLPPQPKRWLKAQAPDGRVRGAYLRSTDQVWLFTDHLRGADEFVRVTLHEAFHRGLANTIPETKALLRQMHRTNAKLQAATADQMRQHKIGRDEAIEEALAVMAEDGTARDLSGWDQLLATVRSWLQKLASAIGMPSMTWTDDMIEDFVAGMRREGLKGGVHVDRDIAPVAMSRAEQPESEGFDVKGKTANTLAHYRGMSLQLLGRRQLVDLYAKDIPSLASYGELVQRMDAEKNETAADADTLATDWAKLPDERQLAELMHDATLAQIDPDKDHEPGDNIGEWRRLRSAFNGLSEKAQATYRKARDTYGAHHTAVRAAIRGRIERSELGSTKKKELLERMDADFFKKVKGVYFPLARFGQYVTVVRNRAGDAVSVNRAETLNEAEAMRKELLKQFPAAGGFQVGKVLKDREFNAARDGVGRGFMADLFQTLEAQGAGEELQDAISQLYLSALPDLSWAKHGIHRKGTPGFSQDARRAFAQNVFHGARYLAKLRYADQLHFDLDRMQKEVDEKRNDDAFDSVKGQQVVDEMVKRHELLMNPKTNPVSTALTSLGFIFHLGLSPASAMVNLSQTALVAYPIMGARWGFTKSAAALATASREAAGNRNDISKALKGQELDAYEEAVRTGVIDVTMAHDLAGIAQGEDAKVAWRLRPVMKWASFLFHHAERFNRQVTFIAAYRLARETGAAHAAAYEQAVAATYDGHFDYGASNRPRLMQGNVAKVVLLFKQYAQNMIYTLTRQAYLGFMDKSVSPAERAEARKALGGLLTMHAAAAGALGLPVVGSLLAAASWLGSDDDEPWDAEVALQNTLADAFGNKAAEVMTRGVSRLTPWDISGRVGLDKLLLPDIQEGLEGRRAAEAWYTALGGPVVGIGVGMVQGLSDIAQGQFGRGLESMMPAAVRGPLKAYRFGEEGAIDKTGVEIVADVGVAGVAGQALGFSPSKVRQATEGKSAIFQHDRRLQDRRSQLVGQFARAFMAGDQEAVAELREDIRAFNEKNRDRSIKPENLRASVAARRRRIEDAEQGVYLPKKRRDAMEAGRFATAEAA